VIALSPDIFTCSGLFIGTDNIIINAKNMKNKIIKEGWQASKLL
jgi:hypothetical protein